MKLLKVKNDEHYLKGLKWLVGEAERLEEDGLHEDLGILPHVKTEMLLEYNKWDRHLAIYRNTKAINENPELKTEYREIGWEFEEPEPEPIEPPAVEPNTPEIVAEPIAEPIKEEKPVDYVDWLDD